MVAYLIICHGLDVQEVLARFGVVFLCRYLEIPLGLRRPSRVELQPIINKISGTLKVCKGKLMDILQGFVWLIM
jgi:hypothetical protein